MYRVFVANAYSAASLSVIRSLGRNGVHVTAATDDRKDGPVYSAYTKKRIFLESDPKDVDGRIDELLQIVSSHRYDVFLPVMSETLLRGLTRRKREFETYTRLPIPNFDQFDVFDDKSQTHHLMQDNDVPAPKTHLVSGPGQLDDIAPHLTYPVLIKPHRGETSAGVSIISNAADLESRYAETIAQYGPCLIQQLVPGDKHTAVFLVDSRTRPKRFFVHRAVREYPITGGPSCCVQSVRCDAIYDYGLKLLQAVNYTGLASMEFIIDPSDGLPKIIDVNPRFYGPLQGAVAAGVDLPFALCRLAVDGDIETDLSYRLGVTCRSLLFEDTRHMISVLRGKKSLKYNLGRWRTLMNFLKFHKDDSYFFLSLDDPKPALVKLYYSLFRWDRLQRFMPLKGNRSKKSY